MISLGYMYAEGIQEKGTDHRSTPESSFDPKCFDSEDRRFVDRGRG
jgi:hypothetical protein